MLSGSGRGREGGRERGKDFSGWREGGESGEGRGGDGKEVSIEYRVLDVHVVEVHEHWWT